MWQPATDVHPQPTVILKRFFSVGNARARMKCFLWISVSCNHHLELLENVVFHSLLQFIRHSLLVVATANCKRQASSAEHRCKQTTRLSLLPFPLVLTAQTDKNTTHTHLYINTYAAYTYARTLRGYWLT